MDFYVFNQSGLKLVTEMIVKKNSYSKSLKFFLFLLITFISMSTVFAYGSENSGYKSDASIKNYSVGLGATRIIYGIKSKGSVMYVNNPNPYPMLVQSTVKSEDYKSNSPFAISPPLFRLDAKQQSKIKIILTGEPLYSDRETLYWMCIMGIPPKLDDNWSSGDSLKVNASTTAAMQFNVRVSQCIKLIVRPDSLTQTPNDVEDLVTWSVNGKKLKASNPTKYYMNVNSISVDNVKIQNPDYISPLSDKYYSLPNNVIGKTLEWSVISDTGGDSELKKVNLNKP